MNEAKQLRRFILNLEPDKMQPGRMKRRTLKMQKCIREDDELEDMSLTADENAYLDEQDRLENYGVAQQHGEM